MREWDDLLAQACVYLVMGALKGERIVIRKFGPAFNGAIWIDFGEDRERERRVFAEIDRDFGSCFAATNDDANTQGWYWAPYPTTDKLRERALARIERARKYADLVIIREALAQYGAVREHLDLELADNIFDRRSIHDGRWLRF